MATTLLLDRTEWDIVLDASGNIAMASEPYAIIQDVASACRLFTNEIYYGGSSGIPYFEQVLGRFQPIQVLKAQLVRTALTVPGVVSARAFLTFIGRDRQVRGQVQVTLGDGSVVPVTL